MKFYQRVIYYYVHIPASTGSLINILQTCTRSLATLASAYSTGWVSRVNADGGRRIKCQPWPLSYTQMYMYYAWISVTGRGRAMIIYNYGGCLWRTNQECMVGDDYMNSRTSTLDIPMTLCRRFIIPEQLMYFVQYHSRSSQRNAN